MRSLHRFPVLFAALLAGLGIACKDSPGPVDPVVIAQEMQKVSGDGQSAVRGGDLALPLRVHVTGSNGLPFSGANVQWILVDGSATLLPAQSTTNASGDAEVLVTSVATVGSVSVRATVQNLTPVVFSLTGLDPCDFANARQMLLETTKTGTLGLLDCLAHGNRLRDLYRFSLASQEAVIVRLRSTSFDPMTELYPPVSWYLNAWGTSGTGDVQLKAVLPPGTYGLAPTSYDPDMTGSYELALSRTAPSAESCEWVFTFADITTAQSLASTDCQLSGSQFAADHFVLVMQGGEVITLTETSTAFAPYLLLIRENQVVAESDGTATGTATITYTSDAPALYFVYAASALQQQFGAYTLGISSSIPSAARTAARSTILSTALHRSIHDDIPAMSFPQQRTGAVHVPR